MLDANLEKHLGCDGLLARPNKDEEDMLGADVVVTDLQRLAQ